MRGVVVITHGRARRRMIRHAVGAGALAARARIPEAAAEGFGLPEEHEDIRRLPMAAEEAFALLDAGRITNAAGALALFWLRHHRPRLREAWTR